MRTAWDPEFAERSPLFEPLRAMAKALPAPCWPGCDDLNRVLDARGSAIVTANGMPLRFVEQPLRHETFEEGFEPRIFLHGEVQFRPCNWHDLFNALVWLTFPAAKAALNQRHYHELVQQRADGGRNRGPVQDALTLFDEGGVIVCVADPALAALMTGFLWKELFWQHRAAVARSMRFNLFGHALYEKGLRPFTGVTGRAVIFEVGEKFFDLAIGVQLVELDTRLANRLCDTRRFLATRDLAPLPILGVPGWCKDNAQECYYDDTGYFRPAPDTDNRL